MNRVGWINGRMADDGLDALGFKQRVGLFLLLRNEPVSAIFVSQLKRSRQTAEPLAAHFKLRPVVRAELNEFQGGVFQGTCKAFLRGRARNVREAGCDATSADPMVKSAEKFLRSEAVRSVGKGIQYRAPGGGESVEDVALRLKRFVRRFPLRFRDKTVVIIGHGGTNRFLLANLMGWPLQSARRIRQKHTQVFKLERTGPKSKPKLSIYLRGKWTLCDKSPAPATGLPCMSQPVR